MYTQKPAKKSPSSKAPLVISERRAAGKAAKAARKKNRPKK